MHESKQWQQTTTQIEPDKAPSNLHASMYTSTSIKEQIERNSDYQRKAI